MKYLMLMTGVLALSLALLGCVAPRQVAELRMQVNQLQNQLAQNNALLMANRSNSAEDSKQIESLKAQITQVQNEVTQTKNLLMASRANPPENAQIQPDSKVITITPAMEIAELKAQISRLQSQLAEVNALLLTKTEAPETPVEPKPITPTVAPPTFANAPQTVVVTPAPEVQYVVDTPNLFYYGNTWYYYDDSGWWFSSYHHNGPWVVLDHRVVPPVFGRIPEPYIRHHYGREAPGGRPEHQAPPQRNEHREHR